MRVHIKLASRIALILTLLLVTVLVSTAVMAQSPDGAPATGANPNADVPAAGEAAIQAEAVAQAAGTAYKVLPPGAFSSDGQNPGGFFTAFGGGYVVGLSSSQAVCMVAPLDLPAGVTVTSFEVRLMDAQAGFGTWVRLDRLDLQTGGSVDMATIQTPTGITGGAVWLVDNTVNSPVVSNMAAYQVTTCLFEGIYLYGVRVGYQSQTMLPLVVK